MWTSTGALPAATRNTKVPLFAIRDSPNLSHLARYTRLRASKALCASRPYDMCRPARLSGQGKDAQRLVSKGFCGARQVRNGRVTIHGSARKSSSGESPSAETGSTSEGEIPLKDLTVKLKEEWNFDLISKQVLAMAISGNPCRAVLRFKRDIYRFPKDSLIFDTCSSISAQTCLRTDLASSA